MKTEHGSTTESERRRGLWACIIIIAVTILDISKIGVGIPAIEDALGAQPSQVQLAVAGYTLTFGLTLVPAGRLGDLGYRRTLWGWGIAIFSLASLVAAAAPTADVLVIARLCQGVAAGMVVPQAVGLVQLLFSGRDRARAFGMVGAAAGVAVVLGPSLGGLLIGVGGPEFGWRLMFLVNVPFAMCALPFVAFVPKSVRVGANRMVDPVGILLLTAACIVLMAPFALTTGRGEDNALRWLLLVLLPPLVVVFVRWERRYSATGRTPLVEMALFRIPTFRRSVAVGFVYYGAMPPTLLATTLFLQDGLGLSALGSGLLTIPFPVGVALMSWLGSRSVERFGARVTVAGLIAALVGIAGAALSSSLLDDESTPIAVCLSLGVAGLGAGAVTAPLQAIMLSEIGPHLASLAGALGQVAQRIGNSIGIAVVISVYYASLGSAAGPEGVAPSPGTYHEAYRNGLIVVLGFLAVALAVAVAPGRRPRE